MISDGKTLSTLSGQGLTTTLTSDWKTYQSMGELARKLITREKINCTHTNVTMNAPMEELTSIRKELKAIGINVGILQSSS